MELDPNKICIVHYRDIIIKVFDNSKEGLEFADTLPKNLDAKCDSLESFKTSVSWETIKDIHNS